MSRLSSRLTSGRRRTPRTTLKIDALAPIPSASVTTTVAESPLARLRERSANLRSRRRVILVPLHVGWGIVYGIALTTQRLEGGRGFQPSRCRLPERLALRPSSQY